jgi:hypothetical protein
MGAKMNPNDDDDEYDANYVASAGDGTDNPTINKTIMMAARGGGAVAGSNWGNGNGNKIRP